MLNQTFRGIACKHSLKPAVLVTMAENGGEDPRDKTVAKLLTNNGVRPANARALLDTIKAIYEIKTNSDPMAAPDVSWQFRRSTNKKRNPDATVAGEPFADFQRFAEQNLWAAREANGFPYYCDVFEFIDEVYGEWIERGLKAAQPLCQADIKSVDYGLYERFHRDSSQHGRPEWLFLPPAREAALVGMSQEQTDMVLARRAAHSRDRQSKIENALNEKPRAESTLSTGFDGHAQIRPSKAVRASKPEQVAGKPFEEFRAYAADHQWEFRQHQGFGYRCDVFAYINAVYGEWIERGVGCGKPLTRADIKSVGERLILQLDASVRKKGMPEWLHLPRDGDAAMSLEELRAKLAKRPPSLGLLERRTSHMPSFRGDQ